MTGIAILLVAASLVFGAIPGAEPPPAIPFLILAGSPVSLIGGLELEFLQDALVLGDQPSWSSGRGWS